MFLTFLSLLVKRMRMKIFHNSACIFLSLPLYLNLSLFLFFFSLSPLLHLFLFITSIADIISPKFSN